MPLSESSVDFSWSSAELRFAFLETIFENTSLGMSLCDRDLRYRWINQHLADINGLPRAETVGKTVREVVPTLSDEIEARLRRVLDTGEPMIDREVRGELRSAPGVQRVWLATTLPVRIRGEIVGCATMVREITADRLAEAERARANAEEIRRRDLEALGQERDRFLAILAHDLRTPLGVVEIAVEMVLQKQLGGPLPGILQRTARKMHRMVNNFIEWARKGAGFEIPIAPRDGDLFRCCQQAIEELAMVHPSVRFVQSYEGSGLGAWDPDRIDQLLGNLLGNAATHVPEGTVSLSARGMDEQVVIEIHNDGTPIPRELMKQLFTPFHHRRATFQGLASSMGLGLYISHQIVVAHHGSIECTSSDQGGTTFRIALPRKAGV